MFDSKYLAAALILIAVAALATERLIHYPIGIMCVLGLVEFARSPARFFGNSSQRFYSLLFGCIWLPMLLSLSDAVNVQHAMKTTWAYLHFLPLGWYIIAVWTATDVRKITVAGIAVILAVWCADGVLQLLTGSNVLGFPRDGAVLTGMFYPNQRYGLVLAVFAPVAIYAVHRLALRNFGFWLLILPFIVVVTLSLKRSAWIMLAVSVVAYTTFFLTQRTTAHRRRLAVWIACAGLLTTSLALFPNVQTQLTGSLEIFSADFDEADRASAYRLSLWRTGAAIATAHWFNGIGPRGYRHVYRNYAHPEDFWLRDGRKGQTHPHLMSLEVWVETGIVGFVAYLAVLALLAHRAWSMRRSAPGAVAFTLVAGVAWFPLNAHLAFYGSYWSTIAWLAIALACASGSPPENNQATGVAWR